MNGLAKYSKLSDLADQRAPKPDVHSGVQRSSKYTYCTMRKRIEIKFFSCTVDTKHTAWAGREHTFFHTVAKLNVQNVVFFLKKSVLCYAQRTLSNQLKKAKGIHRRVIIILLAEGHGNIWKSLMVRIEVLLWDRKKSISWLMRCSKLFWCFCLKGET